MECDQFDATLGGAEHLPFSANSLRFATSRSIEIAAMTESILRPSKTKLIFQTLPVHMRRRVMSHNAKRLPIKFRKGHMEQLKKSGLPPKQKRPSRKYRRRPGNLLNDYNRRQRNHVWLETHIWHAKRFHITERWGFRLADAPCDKAFRACYRATSAHCLMQDISYYTPILIKGTNDRIKDLFSSISSNECGLGITARAYINGNREGHIHLFRPYQYPKGYIGKVSYIWENSEEQMRHLWIFVHPSQSKELESTLLQLTNFGTVNINVDIPEKRRKVENTEQKIEINILASAFNRFRLTGPLSHAILSKTLKCVENIEKIKHNKWVSTYYSKNMANFKLEEKSIFWKDLCKASTASQLSPSLVIGLIVKDPRVSRPSKRTKAKYEHYEALNSSTLIDIPLSTSYSPLWNVDIHNTVKELKLTNAQYITHVTTTQLVPGEVYEDDPILQSVPIVLVQRPGSQNPKYKKLGYGCGWDVIVPSGYGMQFWQTFIMFGARSGGLRETESIAFETGQCYLPPDSEAGKLEEKRIESELRDKYFRRPPSKRVNYIKLGITSPFLCQWSSLLYDWCNKEIDTYFVLRNRNLLNQLQDCLDRRSSIPPFDYSANCLVPVYVQMVKKGHLKRNALICLPIKDDHLIIDKLFEPQHDDENEKLRKVLKLEHYKNIKRLRKKSKKRKLKGIRVQKEKKSKQAKKEPSDYVKKMQELWVPNKFERIRYSCSREQMGYLSQAAFSFSEAKTCGIGYIPYNALGELLKNKLNYVLVRNTLSFKYRMANIQIIK